MTLRLSPAPRSSAGRVIAERGSTLAALVAMLAVGSILMTVATTQWTFIIRREKEKELIFRGTAIARAVQEFQQRQGGSPTTLEQMTKTRPPCLRQIPADPMTARYDRDGKLIEGTGQWKLESAPVQGQSPQRQSTDQPGRGPAITPFIGVRSTSEDLSIGSFRGSEPGVPYSEWRFQVLSVDVPNNSQHVGGFDPIYPPGFGGLRAPGGPPVAGDSPGGGAQPPQGRRPPR